MRRVTIAVTLLFAPALRAAGQTPYRVTWWDGASVTAAGALALLPSVLKLPHGPPPCAPCDPASLWGIDHAALHTFSGTASTASSAVLVGVVGLAGGAVFHGAPAQERGNVALLANSLAWSAAANQWLKVATHRSRPVLYTPDAAGAAAQADNRRSFPSGHATVAFAAATSYAILAHRERLPHRTRNAILLYAGAVGVSALRVAAGKHFPTDVAAGAALGSGIGWLSATVHPTNP